MTASSGHRLRLRCPDSGQKANAKDDQFFVNVSFGSFEDLFHWQENNIPSLIFSSLLWKHQFGFRHIMKYTYFVMTSLRTLNIIK